MLPPCAQDPEGLALLMACKENPLDLAPRLILTDWLEDHGEEDIARCLRESMAGDGCLVPLPTHVQERWQPLNGCDHGWLCLRPVAETVEQKLDELRDCPWFGALSLRGLSLSRVQSAINHPSVSELVRLAIDGHWPEDSPGMRWPGRTWFPYLAFLSLHSVLLGDADIIALIRDPALQNLRSLDLRGNSQDHTLIHLGDSPLLKNLQELKLTVQSADGLLGLLNKTDEMSFESLEADGMGFRVDFLEQLARTGIFPRLRRLRLPGGHIHVHDLRQALKHLESSRLELLDVSGNLLGQDGIQSLARSPIMRHVTAVNIADTHCSNLGDLLRSPNVGRLQSLTACGNHYLDANNLSELGTITLPNLSRLKMTRCELTGEAIRNLASSPLLDRLTHLDLSQNRLGTSGVRYLAAAPVWQVGKLKLAENFIGEDGLSQLTRSANLRTVTHLDLEGNGIEPRGLEELAESPHAVSLRELSLRRNPLRNRGLHHLAASPWLSEIRRLNLAEVGMSDEGLRTLLYSPHLEELTVLNLWGNAISDAGAETLSRCSALASLTDLHISQEHLTDTGRNALRNSPYLRHTIIHW